MKKKTAKEETKNEAPEKSKSERCYPIKTIVVTIICGYLTGVAATVIWLSYFSTHNVDNFDVSKWIFFVLLVLFLLILCYSRSVRCVITLAIPILCSTRGRALVIAFAFLLAATGPTLNILRNVDVLISSMTCGQTQLKEALGNMLDVIKQPLVTLKDMIGAVMTEIRQVMGRVELVLFRIQELVLILVASIKNAFSWLDSIVSVCNKEFGTPFERCMHIAHDAMEDCRAKLGPIKGLCKVTHLFSMFCYSVKVIDVICVLVVFFNDAIIQQIMTEMARFKREVKNLFDVSITFDHDFYFKTVASKELSEVAADIMTDIHGRMRTLLLVFGYLDVVGTLLTLGVIIKAVYFKMKYKHNRKYNNKYITRDFLNIEAARQRNNQELALPLTSSERKKYVQLTDCRVTRMEMRKIVRSMLFLSISCIQLFCICFADYSLFWLLAMISYYGHQQEGMEIPLFLTVEVRGGGFVGDIFQGIVRAFEPLSTKHTVETKSCLPVPRPPNFERYFEIGALCVLAWMLAIFQPYGLRLRHAIMRWYYPEVARERAMWLYNDILMKRVSFFKFARRKARARFLHDKDVDDFSFLNWLRAKTNRYYIFRFLLGAGHGDYCIICSKPLKADKVTCVTIGCKGVYCQNCYKESNNTCCVCQNPMDYGDLSDISEVRDSSDEPDAVHVDDTEHYCSTDRIYSQASK